MTGPAGPAPEPAAAYVRRKLHNAWNTRKPLGGGQ